MNATNTFSPISVLTFDDAARHFMASANMRRNGCVIGHLDAASDERLKPGSLIRTEIGGFVFCTKGRVDFAVNGTEFRLERNQMIFILPKTRIVIRSRREFSARCLILDSAPAFRGVMAMKHVSELMMRFAEYPVIRLTPEQIDLCFMQLHNIRHLTDRGSDSEFCAMAVRNAVASFLYSLGDVLSDPVLPRQEVKRSVKDRRNSYFVRFIQLLAKHYREQRRLGFYAEQLNLTPKYLTTLVREVSGRSAGEWIDYFVINDALFLLKNSDRSIQQIAYDLNFPNQSFFGVFFKAHVGCSPSNFRLQSVKQPL